VMQNYFVYSQHGSLSQNDTDTGKKMFAGCVAHPSGGLSYSEAHPRITALMNMAKLANQPTGMIADTFDSR